MSRNKQPEPPPSPEEQAVFLHACLQEPTTKTVSDTADRETIRLLEGLRNGWGGEVEKALNELERLYSYASACPSKRGFSSIMHALRLLVTHAKPMPHIVLPGEDYDPETGTSSVKNVDTGNMPWNDLIGY